MNEEQAKRLEELRGQKELTDEETQELSELEALHTDSKGEETPEEGAETPEEPEAEENSSEEEEALTEEEAKALVTQSVKEANTEIKEAIKEVVESSSKAVTGDDVEAIVTKALGDREELTEEAVKSLIENTIKSFKGESKMKHEAKDAAQVSVPTTERKGNMPVHQKQLLNVMTGKHIDADIPESVLADAKAHGDRRIADVRAGRKDLTSTTANAGAELTPTDLSATLQERLYLESAVAATFAAQEVNMPSNPFKIPVGKTRPAFVIKADNTAPAADEAQTTGDVTLDAEKLIGYVQYSYELDEDAIMAVLPMITNQLAAAAAEAVESAIINGQESGVIDTGQALTGPEGLCDGLRKLADVTALKSGVTGQVTAAKLLTARKAMGKWGMRPADTVIITGFKAYNDIVGLSQVETLDTAGPNASAFTGFVPKIYGMEVIPSAVLSDAVTNTGRVTGGTNNTGQFLIVHKPSFVVGVRRDFTVETDRDITSQSNQVVASFRRDFKALETPSATITPIHWGIGVA